MLMNWPFVDLLYCVIANECLNGSCRFQSTFCHFNIYKTILTIQSFNMIIFWYISVNACFSMIYDRCRFWCHVSLINVSVSREQFCSLIGNLLLSLIWFITRMSCVRCVSPDVFLCVILRVRRHYCEPESEFHMSFILSPFTCIEKCARRDSSSTNPWQVLISFMEQFYVQKCLDSASCEILLLPFWVVILKKPAGGEITKDINAMNEIIIMSYI